MIKEIQGLRAIAIIMVLVVHGLAIVPPSWQDYVIKLQRLFFTSTGVEIFFVLAGYFLIYSLERFLKASAEKEIGKVETLLMFLVKKFKRLAPNVYFWASIIFIFGLLSKNQYPWQDSIIETKKFLSTIMFLRNFTETTDVGWFGVYWAVSLELQVFILFSTIYVFLGKRISIYLSLFFISLMTFFRFGGADYVYLFRFDSILYGVIVFYLLEYVPKSKLKEVFSGSIFLKSFVSLSLIVILSGVLRIFSEYPNLNISISAVIASIMVLLALSDNGYFYVDLKYINKSIDWIASRSYSIYCSHMFSWFLVKKVYSYFSFTEGEGSFILGIVVMVIFSEVSYRYIENYLK